jgi:hypothetical protein
MHIKYHDTYRLWKKCIVTPLMITVDTCRNQGHSIYNTDMEHKPKWKENSVASEGYTVPSLLVTIVVLLLLKHLCTSRIENERDCDKTNGTYPCTFVRAVYPSEATEFSFVFSRCLVPQYLVPAYYFVGHYMSFCPLSLAIVLFVFLRIRLVSGYSFGTPVCYSCYTFCDKSWTGKRRNCDKTNGTYPWTLHSSSI